MGRKKREGHSGEVRTRAKVWCQQGAPFIQYPDPLFPEHTVGMGAHEGHGKE